MVAKKPEDRPQTMLQVIAELERYLKSNAPTVSVAAGSNPLANAGTGNELQQFLRQLSGESSGTSSRTGATATAEARSERDAETIVDSASDSKTGLLGEKTIALPNSEIASSSKLGHSRKAILISVSVVVVVVLAVVFAMSGKSGKPTDENLATKKTVGKETQPKSVGETTAVTQPDDLVSSPATSPMDAALQFDGDDIVTIPTLPFDLLSPFTWEAYVAVPQKSPFGRDGVVIGVAAKGESLAEIPGGDSPAQFLSLTKELKWRWKYGSGKEREGNVHSIATARAERTHLACVCEGKTHRLYVDGKLQKNAEWDTPRKAAGQFEFGPRFVGIIDEVRVSKVARYKENFTPMSRYEPDADTLGLYHFDEADGDELQDSSGNNHHGQIVGATWVMADGSAIVTPADVPASQPAATPAEVVYLDDLKEKSSVSLFPLRKPEMESFAKEVENAFRLDPALVKHGLIAHPLNSPGQPRNEARFVYELGARFATFQTIARCPRSRVHPLFVEVFGDDKSLAITENLVNEKDRQATLNVDVRGVKELTIVVFNTGANATSHVILLDPRLTPQGNPVAPAANLKVSIPTEALTFGGHRYLLVESTGHWRDAKTKAVAMGGHLVTINSREERDWVQKLVPVAVAGKVGVRVRAFIGASRPPGKSQWTWVTGEPFDESLQPSKVGNREKGIALTWIDNSWDDVGGAYVGSHFIVEWDTLGN